MATLPENDRLTGPFVAIAAQVAFDADWPLIDAPGDPAGTCVVIRRERAGVITEHLLASGFFSITATSASAFTATLAVGATAGDRYWLIGRQKQKRLRAHPEGGSIRTPTLEDDARELAARAQEARRDLDRAVTAPFGEAGLELQAAADRAGGLAMFDGARIVGVQGAPGQFLTQDADGVWTAASGTGTDAALRADLAAPAGTGAALVGYRRAATGAVTRTLASKLGDVLNAADFTGAADARIEAAVAACGEHGGLIHINPAESFDLTTVYRGARPHRSALLYHRASDTSQPGFFTLLDGLVLDLAEANAQGLVNELQIQGVLHPAVTLNARSDLSVQDPLFGPGQGRLDVIRASLNMQVESVDKWRVFIQLYQENSGLNGAGQHTWRITQELNGVGGGDFDTPLSGGDIMSVIEGQTSGATGLLLSYDADSVITTIHNGKFQQGEIIKVGAKTSTVPLTAPSIPAVLAHQWIHQGNVRGNVSVGGVTDNYEDLFTVAGDIGITPTRDFNQFKWKTVTNPGVVFHRDAETFAAAGGSIRRAAVDSATSRLFRWDKWGSQRRGAVGEDLASLYIQDKAAVWAPATVGPMPATALNTVSYTNPSTGRYNVTIDVDAEVADYRISGSFNDQVPPGWSWRTQFKAVGGFTIYIYDAASALADLPSYGGLDLHLSGGFL